MSAYSRRAERRPVASGSIEPILGAQGQPDADRDRRTFLVRTRLPCNPSPCRRSASGFGVHSCQILQPWGRPYSRAVPITSSTRRICVSSVAGSAGGMESEYAGVLPGGGRLRIRNGACLPISQVYARPDCSCRCPRRGPQRMGRCAPRTPDAPRGCDCRRGWRMDGAPADRVHGLVRRCLRRDLPPLRRTQVFLRAFAGSPECSGSGSSVVPGSRGQQRRGGAQDVPRPPLWPSVRVVSSVPKIGGRFSPKETGRRGREPRAYPGEPQLVEPAYASDSMSQGWTRLAGSRLRQHPERPGSPRFDIRS